MSHHHHSTGRNLLLAIGLNILITIGQFVGGMWSGSLSLLSDALHNLSDVLSLLVSYIADRLSHRRATNRKTFGYKRAEILAAFVNAASLIVVAIYLIREAIERLLHPQEVGSLIVIALAILGVLANFASVILLHKDAKSNMNMRSAYLHLLTDAMASVAVLLGGILMHFYGWYWVDSVLTLLIALYLIVAGYKLLLQSSKVLMLFTPDHIDLEAVKQTVEADARVAKMFHIHIWQLHETETHLEAQIQFAENLNLVEFATFVQEISNKLQTQYGIHHVTIQPEAKN
ncbi:MAG: cation diffusion facilitator family transporter [Flavobacteriaceae bacterium]|nr:cation diffusion facilitator family transporter [Flavobacteriaceae bacterium]